MKVIPIGVAELCFQRRTVLLLIERIVTLEALLRFWADGQSQFVERLFVCSYLVDIESLLINTRHLLVGERADTVQVSEKTNQVVTEQQIAQKVFARHSVG